MEQRESDILKEYSERHEAKMHRRKVIVLTLLVTVLLVFAMIATITLVKFYRYNMAESRLIVGEYERAADAFIKMADYRDSKTRVYEAALGLYREKSYEKALPYFVWLDGYGDNGFHLQKCREKLGLEP